MKVCGRRRFRDERRGVAQHSGGLGLRNDGALGREQQEAIGRSVSGGGARRGEVLGTGGGLEKAHFECVEVVLGEITGQQALKGL